MLAPFLTGRLCSPMHSTSTRRAEQGGVSNRDAAKGPARVAGGPAFVRRPDDTVRFPLPFALRQGRREIRSAPRKFARPAQVRRTARPRGSSVGSPHLSILIGFLLASPLISLFSYAVTTPASTPLAPHKRVLINGLQG
jgi:hypothetical protein